MDKILKQYIRHPVIDLTLFGRIAGKRRIQLVSIMFGMHNSCNGRKAELTDDPLLKKYSGLLRKILCGSICDLSEIEIPYYIFTDFQKQVLVTARSIPWGHTVSYSKLAEMSGYPSAVRAVANVMRNNRFPLVIPCHRVIMKDGSIGGFAGCLEGSMTDLKRKLLEMEGVRF